MSIFHQTVEAFKSFIFKKKLSNVIEGRLNIRILYSALGNLTLWEVKNYLTLAKYVEKIQGKEYIYYVPNLKAATFIIIIMVDTLLHK